MRQFDCRDLVRPPGDDTVVAQCSQHGGIHPVRPLPELGGPGRNLGDMAQGGDGVGAAADRGQQLRAETHQRVFRWVHALIMDSLSGLS